MALRSELISDITWSLVAVAIVLGGVIGFRTLGALREPLAAADIERVVPLVETLPLAPHAASIPVRGEGFVRPYREVSLAAEAPGRVVGLHPAILSRGTVGEGEVLVRLDARSARAALTRAESDIDSTRARLELNATQLERAETLRRRGVVSQEELDQRLAEEAELSAALSSLESARDSAAIALENTELRAPFDARVRSREVELGSVVGAGQALATLFTSERLEVTVPLTERAAALVPGLFEAERAAREPTPATVITSFAGREVERPARVTRVAAALGAGTRMLDVTVEIDDPGGEGGSARERPGGRALPSGVPPALLDSYAHVVIEGDTLDGVYALPSTAIRPGGDVWLVVGDTLVFRPAEAVHVDAATSYVRLAALPPGATLATGVVDTPLDGMRVRAQPASSGTGRNAEEGTPAPASVEGGGPSDAAARPDAASPGTASPDAAAATPSGATPVRASAGRAVVPPTGPSAE